MDAPLNKSLKDASGNTNPFVVLPIEVCEVILEKVPDSSTIQNAFEVAPHLTSLSNGKEFSWLIGEVMPLIMSRFFNHKDVLLCRLVSKRWNSAIENALELLPHRLPYNSRRLGKIAETHFMYNDFFAQNKLQFLKTGMDKFLNHRSGIFASKYKGSNPFFGRYFEINIDHPTGAYAIDDVPNVVSFLKRFGCEVWYICFTILCGGMIDEEEFIRDTLGLVFQCLRYLPNLKSMKLRTMGNRLPTIKIPCASSERRRELFNSIRVPLDQKLETLDLSPLFFETLGNDTSQTPYYNFVTSFKNHNQIQKLVIDIDEWGKNMGVLFPNLSELHINGMSCISSETDIAGLPKIRKIFQTLRTQSLRKFVVVVSGTLNVPRLLEILRPHKLKSLQIHSLDNLEYPFGSHIKDYVIVPSVKELSLNLRMHRTLAFVDLKRTLKSFPTLQHLTVEWYGMFHNEVQEDTCKLTKSFANLFLRHADEIYPQSIDFVWDEFPTIQMLTIHGIGYPYVTRYARECGRKQFPLFID